MARFFNPATLQVRMGLELPGCPEILRVQAIQDALHEFCQESEAWREELAPIDIVDGQLDYNLVPEYDAHIHRIEWVRINTEDGVTNEITPDNLDEALFTMTPGDPDVLTLDETLEPGDDVTSGLTVKAILVPEFNTHDIAEWFANRYWKGIVAKALSIRMVDTAKRWTNPTKAAIYEAEFRDQIADARGEKRREYKDGFVGMSA